MSEDNDKKQAKLKKEADEKAAADKKAAGEKAAADKVKATEDAQAKASEDTEAAVKTEKKKRADEKAMATREKQMDKLASGIQTLQLALRDAGREVGGILRKRYVAGDLSQKDFQKRIEEILKAASPGDVFDWADESDDAEE